MKEEKLSGAIQENILTLLVFNDEVCKLIRASLTPNLFESAVFREVATQAIDFIDQFGEAIKEHLPDALEHILKGDDKRKATSYSRLIENLHAAKDSVNADYVVSQLHKFVRQQNLKSAVLKAVERLEAGRVDDAEVELQRGLSNQVHAFEMGTSLGDPRSALSFMDNSEPALATGIHEFDIRGIGPARKEQFVLMAPAKAGKSWGLTHLGKWALLQRQCVLHVTLEMSEARCAQRYIQAFFAVSKRSAQVKLPTFQKDRQGGMMGVFMEEVERLTFSDPNIRAKLSQRIAREFRRRPQLIIKQFPTSTLTVPQLEAYLDGLERFHKIIPDVVIIDYPDLMKQDGDQLRTSIGDTNRALRGLAVARNHAQIIASQANRVGAESRMVQATHAAEDYSKIGTADNVITYSQTPAERKMGLARLFAASVRNEEGGFVTLITQAYAIGQFALDSAPMGGEEYWEYVARGGKRAEEPEDE